MTLSVDYFSQVSFILVTSCFFFRITVPGIALSVVVCISVTTVLILYPREPSSGVDSIDEAAVVTDIDNLFVARLCILAVMVVGLVVAVSATMVLHWTQPIRARVVTKPCQVR